MLGSVVAVVAAGWITGALYGVEIGDPLSWLAAAVILKVCNAPCASLGNDSV